MTRELLNTLFVQSQDAVLRLKDDTVRVEMEEELLLRVPLHHLGSICVFGVVHVTTPLMHRCAEDGRSVVAFDHNGRFKVRIQGRQSGNILLREAQWRAYFSEDQTLDLAKCIVAGKLQNARQVLLRAGQDYQEASCQEAASYLAQSILRIPSVPDIDFLRGVEGNAAEAYFSVFDRLIRSQRTAFSFGIRSKRPPRDRMNALMSFLYSLGVSDCVSALEGVGLDPQCGFLHVLRPGRPALALDLIEEFRSIIYDRLTLTLVNRKEVVGTDFDSHAGGSVMLNEAGRKKVLAAYQKRKQEEVHHASIQSKVPIGLLPHLQARLLARYLRGDLDHYPPYRP